MILPGLVEALLQASDPSVVWSKGAHHGALDHQDEYMVSCLKLFMERIEDTRIARNRKARR